MQIIDLKFLSRETQLVLFPFNIFQFLIIKKKKL